MSVTSIYSLVHRYVVQGSLETEAIIMVYGHINGKIFYDLCHWLLGICSYPFGDGDMCVFGEAKSAYEKGNRVRGQALLEITAREGDQRAIRYFALACSKEGEDNSNSSRMYGICGGNIAMNTSTSTQDFK
jgi:hypothetical protein